MEAYNADHATGYVGVNLPKLQGSYDAGIKNVTIRAATKAATASRTPSRAPSVPQVRALRDIKSGSC